MLIVSSDLYTSRSARQAVERKFWALEAADYLVSRGVYSKDKLHLALAHAKRLVARNTDEGGELLESPQQVVDDDLAYEAS